MRRLRIKALLAVGDVRVVEKNSKREV